MANKKKYTVREHIVPVFYLKLFMNETTRNVHRYSKQYKDIQYRSPRKLAYEDDFYEIYKINNGKKEYLHRNVLENAFGILECRFREAFYDIIQTHNIYRVGAYEKQILSDYVATQFARTKKQHTVMMNVLEFFLNGIKTLPDDNQKIVLQGLLLGENTDDEELLPSSLRDMLYGWMMEKGCFVFLENVSEDYSFYTCDNPVLLFNEKQDLVIDALYMPLSPRFALWVVNEEQFPNLSEISKRYIDTDGVKFFNELICHNADKFIITDEFKKNDIAFLQEYGYDISSPCIRHNNENNI